MHLSSPVREAESACAQRRHEVFVELSWFFVMHGMGLRPHIYDPLVDACDWKQVKRPAV